MKAQRTCELTDLGNAQRLVARHGENIRYVPSWHSWVVWDGQRWAKDMDGKIDRYAKDTVRQIYAEASQTESNTDREDLLRHGRNSESESRLRSMVSLAKTEAETVLPAQNLDTDPYLLNVEDGTIDLRTFLIEPPRQKDYITKLASVVCNPDGDNECPTWEKFIARCMGENEEMIRYLQRALGYGLTGDVSEQCLFFLVGDGCNGKTTLLEVIRTILGDYARQAETKTLVARGRDGIPNDVARLAGARFVVASEIAKDRRLDEAVVKPLTGGDTLTARYLYGEFFEFVPQFKWYVAVNHLPNIYDATEGMWRRIKIIRFPIRIPEQEKDRYLKERLLAEAPGILKWLLAGCREWQTMGLEQPSSITTAVSDYRSEMDVSGKFIEEYCIQQQFATVGVTQLYAAYTAWSKSMGELPCPMKVFNTSLRERGLKTSHKAKGDIWEQIGLREENANGSSPE